MRLESTTSRCNDQTGGGGGYLAEFHVDDTKDNESQAMIGLQCLGHLDVYYHGFENGLDMEEMTIEEFDLTRTEHWDVYGFSYYVMQCVRVLVEGPAGPYYQHRKDVCYIHDLYISLMMSDNYRLTSIGRHAAAVPDLFPRIAIRREKHYGLEEFKKLGFYQKVE